MKKYLNTKNTKKRYRFYIAWKAFSDGACGKDTKIYKQDDLIHEYYKGNENVYTWDIECENENIAYSIGYEKAFFENFTMHDTFSILQEIDEVCPSCGNDNTATIEEIHFDGRGGYQLLCTKCNNVFWHILEDAE